LINKTIQGTLLWMLARAVNCRLLSKGFVIKWRFKM
jgi:hypothetical protein